MHSICSYMAMFPPSVPRTFIEWLTEPGDVVYDPFSGRGTTALEACATGRRGLGSDLNPIACLLSSAKTNPPGWEDVAERVEELRLTIEELPTEDEPEPIQAIFSKRTLGQLLWLRVNLDRTKPVDAFLLAVLLGILHLNAGADGVPRGLSVSMPNTFAMAPGYVMKYIREHELKAPEVDVLPMLDVRAQRYRQHLELAATGETWAQDATQPGQMEEQGERARLVFTSPPYLHVIKYGKFNWIRLWMLGENPKGVDETLFSSSSLPRYLDFMSTVIARLSGVLTEDGRICLVIGDVTSPSGTLHLAEHVAASCVPEDLTVEGIVVDELPADRKVSRIWGQTKGRATKTDRILILSRNAEGALPELPCLAWD